jgi:AraC-like DNA-binding protein
MIIFDASDLRPEVRPEAFRLALQDVTAPTTVIPAEDAKDDLNCLMRYWDFGPSDLVDIVGSGFTLQRDRWHLKIEGPPAVALLMQISGTAQIDHLGHQQRMDPGNLMLVDLTAPYSFGWSGEGGVASLQVSHDMLGLPRETIRRAIGRVDGSPLAPLTRQHLRFLRDNGDDLSPGAAAGPVGAATADLLRALIVSAADGDALTHAARDETLSSRLMAYLHRHLTEPDLTPERIAKEHCISIRQLYKLCEHEGIQLEQWIISQRLEGARIELLSPAARRWTIAAVASSWGFNDPSHFARRFRAAYGVSPREWQRGHQTGSASGNRAGWAAPAPASRPTARELAALSHARPAMALSHSR